MVATYEASLVAVTPAASGPPTFAEVCGLTSTRLRLIEELNAPGVCEFTTQVDKIADIGKARLRDLLATPNEIWVRRTTYTSTGAVAASPIIFAGPVIGCRLANRKLTITAPGLLIYLRYWLRDTDYAANGVDQATIIQQLCDTWQALGYSNDGIVTTGLTATGVPRILNLSGRDGKFIMPVIQEMGGRTNGFDLTVDPATRALTMWSPRKGVDRTGTVFLDRRSIGVADIAWGAAPGSVGSEVLATSSSTQGTTLTSIKSNTALRQTFRRSYITRQFQDISEQATLDDHAQRAVDDNATQVFIASPELLPVVGFQYGDFSTGDTLTYGYDAGLGEQTFPFRVASIEVNAVDDGRETLKVAML